MPLHFACYTFVFYYLFLIQSDTEFIGVATEIRTIMESDLSIDLNRDTNLYTKEYWSLVVGKKIENSIAKWLI